MRLSKVAIHNFRGITDGSFHVDGYCLLVGANNAGKSTVIDAIRCFYEKGGAKFDKTRDYPLIGATDAESWIELEFHLTDDEHGSLAEQYQSANKTLRVRKRFQTKDKFADGKSSEGYISGYRTDGTLSEEAFYGAKNVQSGKFGDIVFIPAVSKLDEHTKLSGPSALRDLLTNVLEDVVDSSSSYKAFTEQFATFAERIKDEATGDGRSLTGLEGELNKLMESWGTKFVLTMNAPTTTEIIKSMLGHEFIDTAHGKPQSADQFGSGFQRQFIYALIDIASRYVGKKAPKKSKDFAPTLTLILFEEPEAFLHPPQQEVLARGLMKLGQTSNRQVICSTHSSHFVSKNAEQIPSIVRLSRDGGAVAIRQITEEAWKVLVDSNREVFEIAKRWPKLANRLSTDDWMSEMEAIKHCLWLNAERCSLFFANRVLLVEGPTEQAIINRLISEGALRSPEGSVYVLDCIGKYNMHRFINLLAALGITHAVLHDDDHGNEYNADINELIASSCNKVYTTGLQTIRGNLEVLLGVSKTDPHRKPQHVMFQYQRGKIDPAKIKAFCVLVETCLGVRESIEKSP